MITRWLCSFLLVLVFGQVCLAQFLYQSSMDQYGVMSAFGDFYSKRRADVFETNPNGTLVQLLTSPSQPTSYTQQLLLNLSSSLTDSTGQLQATVVNLVPYDFDGDSYIDVLVTTANLSASKGPYSLTVFWNTGNTASPLNLSLSSVVTTDLLDHPFIVDWDADAYPDIFGELDTPGNRVVYLAQPNRTFQFVNLGSSYPPLCRPGSHAFVNFRGIGQQPGLVLCTVVQDGANGFLSQSGALQNIVYEYWDRNVEKTAAAVGAVTNYTTLFSRWHVAPLGNALSALGSSGSIVFVGQPAFADLFSDGSNVQLVALCVGSCLKGSFVASYSPNSGNWSLSYEFLSNFTIPSSSFAPGTKTSMPPPLSGAFTYTLSVGDYNLDGYPDLVAVVTNGTFRKPIILQNAQNGQFAMRNSDFWQVQQAVTAAFYDVDLDGVLDVLVTDVDTSGAPVTRFFMSDLTGYSAYFLKTYVLNGLCNAGGCVTVPYGEQICGATVGYSTVSVNGVPLNGIASQQPQTAHFALQPTYVLFGLSTEPNYVNQLIVRLPSRQNQRYRSWTSLIPNTQLVVLTSPPDSPGSWTAQLFLQPLENNRVLYVAFALIGAFVLVAIVVIVLQIIEVREDRHERLLEAQRFHFDTM